MLTKILSMLNVPVNMYSIYTTLHVSMQLRLTHSEENNDKLRKNVHNVKQIDTDFHIQSKTESYWNHKTPNVHVSKCIFEHTFTAYCLLLTFRLCTFYLSALFSVVNLLQIITLWWVVRCDRLDNLLQTDYVHVDWITTWHKCTVST